MSLERTGAVLGAIDTSLAAGQVDGLIESFLAQYASVVLYSEIESKVKEIIETQLRSFTHEAIASFITATLETLIRRTPKSDISSFIARFGDTFKQSFDALVDERSVSRYANVIKARHEVGHKQGSNITIAEVRLGLDAANHILKSLQECFDNARN